MPRKIIIGEDTALEVLKEELITKTTEALEEPSVPVVTDNVPKRYIASLYLEKEPLAKDIFAGSYIYWDSTNTITFEALVPQYSTDLEVRSGSDILVTKEGRTSLVSRWETPKDWIKNLPFANLGIYICKTVEELYETE
jgi:hypothetical protein